MPGEWYTRVLIKSVLGELTSSSTLEPSGKHPAADKVTLQSGTPKIWSPSEALVAMAKFVDSVHDGADVNGVTRGPKLVSVAPK